MEKIPQQLSDYNYSKIPNELRDIFLQSLLYSRALELCNSVSYTFIGFNSVPDAIISAIYKRDSLNVVIEVYNEFLSLLNIKRGHTEYFESY